MFDSLRGENYKGREELEFMNLRDVDTCVGEGSTGW